MSEPEPTSAGPDTEAPKPPPGGARQRPDRATLRDEPGAGRPFPLMRVLVALFGIAVGLWLWLGSAWRWDVKPKDLLKGRPPVVLRTWVGRYVRLIEARPAGSWAGVGPDGKSIVGMRVGEDGSTVLIRLAEDERASGRVARMKINEDPHSLVVDTTRGRINVTSAVAILIALWGAALISFNIALWRRHSHETVSAAAGARGVTTGPANHS